jgi:DNA-binding CsgD family transcriptional regulator
MSTLVRSVFPTSGLRLVRFRARPGEQASALAARLWGVNLASHAAASTMGLVGAADAALDAIAEQVGRGPVLWIVDDMDLADGSARIFMSYVVRRIAHLPAGVVMVGWRRGEPVAAGAGIVRLHPLPRSETADVVRVRLGPLAPDWVVEEVAESAGGNALAATELSDALSRDEAAGRLPLPDPLPAGPLWSERWLGVEKQLSLDARVAMLVVTVGDGFAVSVLESACARLGIAPAALRALETRRLVSVDASGRCWARRPHRSPAYHCAGLEERQAAHGAVGDAVREVAAPDDAMAALTIAHHHAAATSAPDEGVADRLESALAGLSPDAAVLAGWIKAAGLTDEADRRARRLVAAAVCAWRIGRGALAVALIDQAGPRSQDPALAGTASLVRGAVALSHGLAADAMHSLVEGAHAAARGEPGLAVDLAARASGVAWWAGRADWAETAFDLAGVVGGDDPGASFVREASEAGLAMIRDEFTPAVGHLRRLLRDAENLEEPRDLVFASEVAGLAGDDLGTRRFNDRAIQVMRQRDSATELPFVLQRAALVLAAQGRAEAAAASAREGLVLAARAGEARGGVFQHVVLGHVDALRGDVAACTSHHGAITAMLDGGQEPSMQWALGRLAVSEGRFADALEVLVPVVLGEDRHAFVSLQAAPDLVEAATAEGRVDLALAALDRFGRWRSAGSSWAAAVEPRLVAMAAPDGETEERFVLACHAPGLAYRPLESARTRLAYGSFLRGERRRAEAREQLHLALGLFESLQLSAWAGRTRSALRASGESAAASVVVPSSMTAQELDIARMVGEGLSNREVAARLHLSPRTVEYHLSKVYVKMGLSSRDQLARRLAGSRDQLAGGLAAPT